MEKSGLWMVITIWLHNLVKLVPLVSYFWVPEYPDQKRTSQGTPLTAAVAAASANLRGSREVVAIRGSKAFTRNAIYNSNKAVAKIYINKSINKIRNIHISNHIQTIYMKK
jgi:hypothetical protein